MNFSLVFPPKNSWTGNKASQTNSKLQQNVQTTSFASFGTNTKQNTKKNTTETMNEKTTEEEKKNSVAFSLNEREDAVYVKMCISIRIYLHLENPLLCLN